MEKELISGIEHSLPSSSSPYSVPTLTYREFVGRLKDQKCAHIIAYLKTFLSTIVQQIQKDMYICVPDETVCESIYSKVFSFIEAITEKAIDSQVFSVSLDTCTPPSTTGDTTSAFNVQNGAIHIRFQPPEKIMVLNYFERLVVSNISRELQLLMVNEREKDAELHWKLTWMNVWIQPCHLDLEEALVDVFQKRTYIKQSTLIPWNLWIVSQFTQLDTIQVKISSFLYRLLPRDFRNRELCLQYPKGKMDVLLRICQIASRIISGYHSYEEYITNVETSIVVVVENDVSRLSDGGNEADGAVHVIRLDTFHWANNVTADDLLSMIIWFVIQGCPSTLLFNLALMHKLRHPALFVAEERYYLTTLTSAAEFLYELKVSASLRMPDSGSRQTCIASCPEQHVARWIGDVWNTQGRCEATANSSLGGGEVDSMSTGVSTTLDNCRPLPSSFNIATMFLDAATYATFQKVLGHASCEIAVERLYQYIHHVLTITTPESDNFSVEEDAFPHMLLPVYVHQTISHCVRLVLKRHTTIFQSILNTYGATYDSDSKETIRNFKQKYFRIILLAESFERLLFTQIYDRLFPYIIKLPVSEDKPKSMFKTLTSGFSRSQEMFRKKAEILGRLIIPPFLSNRRSMGTDDEILDTTHFFETSQKLKALCCTSDFFDAFSSDHQNKTVLVIRRLSRLGEYTNPFEKLKTFVALRRVADCVASSRDGTDSSHVCAALAALLLVHTCPAHLVAHLTFTNEYRHPALCCVEAQDALNFTWFAMALVEEYWSKHDSKSLTYSTLLDQLILLNHMY